MNSRRSNRSNRSMSPSRGTGTSPLRSRAAEPVARWEAKTPSRRATAAQRRDRRRSPERDDTDLLQQVAHRHDVATGRSASLAPSPTPATPMILTPNAASPVVSATTTTAPSDSTRQQQVEIRLLGSFLGAFNQVMLEAGRSFFDNASLMDRAEELVETARHNISSLDGDAVRSLEDMWMSTIVDPSGRLYDLADDDKAAMPRRRKLGSLAVDAVLSWVFEKVQAAHRTQSPFPDSDVVTGLIPIALHRPADDAALAALGRITALDARSWWMVVAPLVGLGRGATQFPTAVGRAPEAQYKRLAKVIAMPKNRAAWAAIFNVALGSMPAGPIRDLATKRLFEYMEAVFELRSERLPAFLEPRADEGKGEL
jgi:hypothetical protein